MARWFLLLALGLEMFFGSIHLLYVDVVIALPVAALVVLARSLGRPVARPLVAAAALALERDGLLERRSDGSVRLPSG